MNPTWGKGYSRLGAARFAAGKYAEAVKAYAMGVAHEPTNEALTEGLKQAQAALSAKASRVAPPPPPPSAGGAGGGAGAGAGAGFGAGAGGDPADAMKDLNLDDENDDGADAKPVEQIIGIDLGTTYRCATELKTQLFALHAPRTHNSSLTYFLPQQLCGRVEERRR